MAETWHQKEAIPATYPTAESPALWARLEAYTAHRWTPRAVTWLLNGRGGWFAPVALAELVEADRGAGGAWEETTLSPAPMGYVMPCGRFKVIATVGADNAAPAVVLEAFDRLKAYVTAELGGVPGASTYSVNIGQLSESISRNPAFMARALDNSGAADLLRPYRRV